MSRVSWDRVKEICLAALERSPEERETYLDAACAGEGTLRAEVESLLAQHDPDFLERPLAWVGDLEADPGHAAPTRPRRIGPYRVVRPIGRGGMGEVFLAIQEGEGFERPVAVKLVPSSLATEELLRRFRLERTIQASLDHPYIAKLIDGGATEDGRPFFVMEFVEGLSITEYCDRASLGVTQRLRLFMSVCDAVHHAHQNLIVHRDLKPGNILVTRDGHPKLLDFGIGKVLDPWLDAAADRTTLTGRALTPEYAAPEQMRGEAITTATDVHGLGVLLYELLTGRHPYAEGVTSREELGRALLETTPTSPSSVVVRDQAKSHGGEVRTPSTIARLRGTVPGRLRRRLKGDLDNIVLQALRKEPERRYPSVEAFRADIERHLDGRPVRARPASLGYRFSKLAARNPWLLTAAMLATVALGVAVVLPWRQNRRLVQERDKALEVQDFLLEAFGITSGDETAAAGQLLDLQASRVDSLYGDRPALQAQMMLVLADGYDRLGRYDDALPLAEGALEVLREGDGGAPDLAAALNAVGWAQHRLSNEAEAARYLEEAVGMRRRLGRSARRELARSLNDLGVVREAQGEYDRAAALHREALNLRRSVLGDADRATGVSASNLAVVLYRMGDLEGARREGELALELLRHSVGPDHQRTIIVQNNLAAFKVAAGDYEGAVSEYADLLERQTRLQGAGHPVTISLRAGLATSLMQLGRFREAEAVLRDLVLFAGRLGDAQTDNELSGRRLLAEAVARQDRPGEALYILDEAVSEAAGRRPRTSAHRKLLEERERLKERLGDTLGAVSDARTVVRLAEVELDPASDELAMDRLRLAELLMESGRTNAADSVISRVRPRVVSGEASTQVSERLRALQGAGSGGGG